MTLSLLFVQEPPCSENVRAQFFSVDVSMGIFMDCRNLCLLPIRFCSGRGVIARSTSAYFISSGDFGVDENNRIALHVYEVCLVIVHCTNAASETR